MYRLKFERLKTAYFKSAPEALGRVPGVGMHQAAASASQPVMQPERSRDAGRDAACDLWRDLWRDLP